MSTIYSPITPTVLMVKRHDKTGLLYFCKTTRLEDKEIYNGSGKYWKHHINSHGDSITTLWISDVYNDTSIVDFALEFSRLHNIVESKDWANLIPENGLDGGGGAGGVPCQEKRKSEGLTGSELFYGRSVTQEEIIENSRKGGKIQGKRNAESGHMNTIQALVNRELACKKATEVCRKNKVNAFFDPVLRAEIASKGGKVQGRKNAESGHMSRIAKLPNKRSKGKVWITDGEKNKMIEKNIPLPDGYRYGKTQKVYYERKND